MPRYIKRSELKDGSKGQPICKTYIPEIKQHFDNDRKLNFTISSDSVDRDGDTLEVNGWDISNFIKNPVVLFAHNSRALPVAKASNVSIDKGKLKSDAEFATREVFEFADTVFQLLKGGFLNTTSVGFDPKEFIFNEVRGGIDFLKQELLEFSIVPVPSNPDALISAKAQGIELRSLKKWAEQVLDSTESGLCFPKHLLEKMRKHCDVTDAVHIFVQRKDHNDGVLLDIHGDVIHKHVAVPKILSDEEKEQLKNAAAWANGDTYKLLHHDIGAGSGDVDAQQVKAAMKSLLGLSADCECISSTDYKDVYDHLVEHYKELNIEPPEFKYVSAQVLKHLPDEFIFNDETGTLKQKTDKPNTPPPSNNGLEAKDIAAMVTKSTIEALNKHLGKLD